MITDRIIAALAVLLMIVFIAILVLWVPRIDLIIVAIIVIAMACYDFYRDLGPRRNSPTDGRAG